MNPTHAEPVFSPLRRIRIALSLFIAGLVLSGVTAFPLLHELEWMTAARGLAEVHPGEVAGGFDRWILTVRDGLRDIHSKYPWMAYGTDWLAFAHLVIAVFFIGPWMDPVRNVWVLRAGVIACVGVIPLALICGEVRQIPLGWRLIDGSFGVLGVIPLLYCLRLVRSMESAGKRGTR